MQFLNGVNVTVCFSSKLRLDNRCLGLVTWLACWEKQQRLQYLTSLWHFIIKKTLGSNIFQLKNN